MPRKGHSEEQIVFKGSLQLRRNNIVVCRPNKEPSHDSPTVAAHPFTLCQNMALHGMLDIFLGSARFEI